AAFRDRRSDRRGPITATTPIATACAGTIAATGTAAGAERSAYLALQRRAPETPHDRGHHHEHRDRDGDAARPAGAIPDQPGKRAADATSDVIAGDVEADCRRMAVLGRERDEARRHALAEKAARGGDRQARDDRREPGHQREEETADPEHDRTEHERRAA